MYFWRTTRLAADLRASTVSERDKRNYVIAWSVLATLGGYLALLAGSERSELLVIEGFMTLLITVVGIVMCHDVNRSGDNRAFIERFICMSLPLTIRLIAVMVAFFLSYAIVGSTLGGRRFEGYLDRYNVVDVLFVLAFEAAFYWRLRVHFLKIAGVPSEVDEPPTASE